MSNLFFFNPTNEMAIADGGNGFIPSRYLDAFEKDLEVLPFIFASPEDIVLVRSNPDVLWLESLLSRQKKMPKFLMKNEILVGLKDKTVELQSISPWGWSPRMIKVVEEFVKLSPKIDNTLPNMQWSAEHKEMYGRATALMVLEKIVSEYPNKRLLIEESLFPCRIDNLNEINQHFSNHNRLVIKTPHSSSGRGILMLFNPELNRSNRHWIGRAIRQSGYVMVEPFLDVVAGFSAQFRINSQDCKLLALGAFKTNAKGGYEGNLVGGMETTPEVFDFLTHLNIPELAQITANALKKENIGKFYHGYLGVDLLLCRNHNGSLFMHPCSEINTRQNMGLVACFLSSWISADKIGVFKILRKSNFQEISFQNFLSNNLPVWENGLLKKGIFAITPIEGTEHVAVLEVHEPKIDLKVLYFGQIAFPNQ